MNKYQKSLNRIVKSSCPNCFDENGCTSCDIEKICNATAKDWVNALQELVDRATPKKPLVQKYKYSEHYICPNCNKYKLAIIDYGEYKNQLRKGNKLTLYCPECGQALDWSEEE